MEFSNIDFNSDKPKQYEAVRHTLALIYEADAYQFGPVEVAPMIFQCPITTSVPLKCGLEQQKGHLPKRRKRLGTS